MADLTDQQKRFVAAYLAKPVQAEAAITAGYSAKTAYAMGCKLMKNPRIAAAIEAGQAKLSKKFEITADNVLQELAAIGFANIGDYLNATGRIDIKGLDRAKMAAVSELTVDILPGDIVRTRIKLHDKRAALVDLAKHLGLFRPATPFDDAGDTLAEENTPMREVARELVLAFHLAMRGQKANNAAPAAPPIKH